MQPHSAAGPPPADSTLHRHPSTRALYHRHRVRFDQSGLVEPLCADLEARQTLRLPALLPLGDFSLSVSRSPQTQFRVSCFFACAGPSLREELRRRRATGRAFSSEELTLLLYALAEALPAMRRAGVPHTQLSLDAVQVCAEGGPFRVAHPSLGDILRAVVLRGRGGDDSHAEAWRAGLVVLSCALGEEVCLPDGTAARPLITAKLRLLDRLLPANCLLRSSLALLLRVESRQRVSLRRLHRELPPAERVRRYLGEGEGAWQGRTDNAQSRSQDLPPRRRKPDCAVGWGGLRAEESAEEDFLVHSRLSSDLGAPLSPSRSISFGPTAAQQSPLRATAHKRTRSFAATPGWPRPSSGSSSASTSPPRRGLFTASHSREGLFY